MTLHIREVRSLAASVNLILAVCLKQLLQPYAWSDCYLTSTPLYKIILGLFHT